MKNLITKTLLLVLLCSPVLVSGQQARTDLRGMVDTLANRLKRNYVFADKGEAMANALQDKFKRGEYSELGPKELAIKWQQDLQEVSHDKHLIIKYAPERIAQWKNRSASSPPKAPQKNRKLGFDTVRTIGKNIGYLSLRQFFNTNIAGNRARDVMNQLMEHEVIIIDLRNNIGGAPNMVRLLASHFLGDQPIHLNTFYWRPTDTYTELWSDPELAEKRDDKVPLYILTSAFTFSAGEGFAYHLKHLKRATVVGEITGGGAHPIAPHVIGDSFIVNLPQGRAINPVTGTNWEGVGVVPHVKVPAADALEKVLQLIREGK